MNLNYVFILFVVFLTLKLAHVLDWSWLVVTAPLWAGVAAAVSLLAVTGLLASATRELNV